jgi:hypothetical protein
VGGGKASACSELSNGFRGTGAIKRRSNRCTNLTFHPSYHDLVEEDGVKAEMWMLLKKVEKSMLLEKIGKPWMMIGNTSLDLCCCYENKSVY